MFRKILSFISILLILFPAFSFADEIPNHNTNKFNSPNLPMGEEIATSENNYFIVTAYYSPLLNQKSYLT
jgi:hypothetical protein